jgi:hypothetical protein
MAPLMSREERLDTTETGGPDKGQLVKGRRKEEVTTVLCIWIACSLAVPLCEQRPDSCCMNAPLSMCVPYSYPSLLPSSPGDGWAPIRSNTASTALKEDG